MSSSFRHDVLVIGSGAAGLSLALRLPDHCRVALLSKADLTQGSTYWAQGGMAAVLHDRDTIASHVEDTLAAGAGLCQREAVEFTVSNSRRCVEWLVEQGVDFDLRRDQTQREFHLTMEGGHSHRRIIHAADRTGRAIAEVLAERALEADNIEIYRISAPGAETVWLTRVLDLAIVGNSKDLVTLSRDLVTGMSEEDTMSEAADYHDMLSEPLRDWAQRVKQEPNSLSSLLDMDMVRAQIAQKEQEQASTTA